MSACEQLCLLLLLLGVIKCTIALDPDHNDLNKKIEMMKYKIRSETEELKNSFLDLRLYYDNIRYHNDALERILNNVKGISSGPNVQTLVEQIDTEKKRNNKQADQIDQLKERIEGLDYQLHVSNKSKIKTKI